MNLYLSHDCILVGGVNPRDMSHVVFTIRLKQDLKVPKKDLKALLRFIALKEIEVFPGAWEEIRICRGKVSKCSRWWFQIFCIFTPTWGRFPF